MEEKGRKGYIKRERKRRGVVGMPNGMLSVKLSEMEIQIRRLHEKICVLETDELKNIKNEM